jgi:HSP20 family protein
MANLVKRDNRGYADPWKDFFDLDLFSNRLTGRGTSLPAVNICEDEKNYMVDVVAPGFKKSDFKINMEDDLLTISAESKNENKESTGKEYSRREYSYSSFTRSFHLPEDVKTDSINAKYEDGVLKIMIPKSEQKPKSSKQINVE